MHERGDCGFFENPQNDARNAQPFWQPDPDIALAVVPDEDPDTAAPLFDPWSFPGRKTIGHDGSRLSLKLTRSGRSWQVHIVDALDTTMRFTFAVNPDERADARLREAKEMLAAITGQRTDFAWPRRSAEPVITMQSLQALDGHLACASEREIAIAIFGEHIVREKWHADSELRARTRYLIRRARSLMNGGYRHLVWGAAARRASEFSMRSAVA